VLIFVILTWMQLGLAYVAGMRCRCVETSGGQGRDSTTLKAAWPADGLLLTILAVSDGRENRSWSMGSEGSSV
jgi:hypothetical protein